MCGAENRAAQIRTLTSRHCRRVENPGKVAAERICQVDPCAVVDFDAFALGAYMKPKKTKLSKTLRSINKSAKGIAQREKLAAVIAELDQIKPPSAKAAKAIALFKSWLKDESGYDEEVRPRLKRALELERARVGPRRLFDA